MSASLISNDENAFTATHGYGTLGSGSHVALVNIDNNEEFVGISGQAEGYSYASTPYIQSGKANGGVNIYLNSIV